MIGLTQLQSEVIEAGLCTGCGTCAAVCPTKAIAMNYEAEEPDIIGQCAPRCQLCYDTCPGKDVNLPGLSQVAFGREPKAEEDLLGVAQGFLKGHALDAQVRDAGAGGGAVSALLIYALEKDIIDAAVVSGMSPEKPWRVVPKIATCREEVMANASSHYAVVPTNSILSEAMAAGWKRLGVVGLPCHVHGLRKIQAIGRPKQLSNTVKFVIGLFCAVNSSYRGTEHVIEELCGIPLGEVAKVEYRGGEYPGNFTVTSKDGRVAGISSAERRLVTNWFCRDRCVMCYDYSSELADISVGDYFHPGMKRGVAGWSVIVVRSDTGKKLVEEAQAAHYLHVESVERDYLLGIGFERKRHGAVYQLMERQKHGWPTPNYHTPLEYPRPMSRIFHLRHPHL